MKDVNYRIIDEHNDMPIEDSGAPKSDPFHYGKRKNWVGAKDGAYYSTNVPAGKDKPAIIEIKYGTGTIKAKRRRKGKIRKSKASIKIPTPTYLARKERYTAEKLDRLEDRVKLADKMSKIHTHDRELAAKRLRARNAARRAKGI